MQTTRSRAAKAAKMAQRSAGEAAITDKDIRMIVSPDASYCRVQGCWEREHYTEAVFSGGGSYGYGKTRLGQINFFMKGLVSGSYIKTYPFTFISTRGTRDVVLSTEDLYLSSRYPGGNSQHPKLYDQRVKSLVKADHSFQWPSPGKGWHNTVDWVTNVCEVVWRDTSSKFPGSWYFWTKSIKLKRQGSGAYRFQSSSTLPSSPSGSGYRRP